MKALFVRYLNEFAGLTIMALMAVALIAGQVDARMGNTVAERAHVTIEFRLTLED